MTGVPVQYISATIIDIQLSFYQNCVIYFVKYNVITFHFYSTLNLYLQYKLPPHNNKELSSLFDKEETEINEVELVTQGL